MRQLQPGNESLIFQHIPKTAGTTLSFIIRRHIDERHIYHIRNLQQLKGPAYSRYFGSEDDFRNQPSDERNRFHCIMGHMPFGMHSCLSPPYHYIAFIRDPVKRVISQFGQYRRMIASNEMDARRITLDAFLSQHPKVLNNHQTRFISGWDDATHSPEACYEKALVNIDRYYSLVGVVERFDESLLLLSRMLHWNNVAYFKRNIGTHRPTDDDIDPATLERIRQANRLDARLHRHAVSLLEEKIRSAGKGFKKDLWNFQRKQSLNQTTHMIHRAIKGWAKRLFFPGRGSD